MSVKKADAFLEEIVKTIRKWMKYAEMQEVSIDLTEAIIATLLA